MKDYGPYYMEINKSDIKQNEDKARNLANINPNKALRAAKKAELLKKNNHLYVSINGLEEYLNLSYSSANRLVKAVAYLCSNSQLPVISSKDEYRTKYLEMKAKENNQRTNDINDIPKTYYNGSKTPIIGIRDDVFNIILEFKFQYKDEPDFDFKNMILKNDNLERALSNILWEPTPDIDVNSRQFNEYKNYLTSRGVERGNRDSVMWVSFQLFEEQMARERELKREIEELKNSIVVRKNANLPSEHAFKLGNKNSNNEFIMGDNEKNYQEFIDWLKTHPNGPGKNQLNPF